MADERRPRIGETFMVELTAAGKHGTWVRALDGSAEGRVVRGGEGLAQGMTVPVRLIRTDSAHGFIDFEHEAAVPPTSIPADRLAAAEP